MSSKTTVREVIFFVVVFLLFYLGCKLVMLWQTKSGMGEDVISLIIGAVITLALVSIFYIAKMNQHSDNYRAFEISPGAMCRGGPYMWQGDSARSKMCQELAKTPEGKCEISKFNCPDEYNGMPAVPFNFTSNSNSSWEGVHCKGCDVDKAWYEKQNPSNCNCRMCSMNVGE